MEFLVTTEIWRQISQEYNQDLWSIQDSDPYFNSGIKHIGNFSKMSLVLLAGLICTIVTPIFLLLDVTHQLVKVFDQRGSDGVLEKRLLNNLIFCAFYENKGNNAHQVSLNDIWNYSDQELENKHDYIQWLFISNSISKEDPSSPIITYDIQNAFKNNVKLRTNLIHSFDRMLQFYGFQRDTRTSIISKANNFEERRPLWMTKDNHNLLRISRILISMSMLGCLKEAQAFYTVLQELSQKTEELTGNQCLKVPLFDCRGLFDH